MNPLDKVAKRFKITAREARDIYTAVGTLGRTVVDKNVIPKKGGGLAGKASKTTTGKFAKNEAAVRNLVKQVRETGKAAATGKMGTTSAKVKTDMRDYYGNPKGGQYKPARKRLTEKQKRAKYGPTLSGPKLGK